MAAFMIIFGLCSCGEKQSFYRTEEGFYFYNGQLYRNDGEIALSEKELEYVELIEEFPEGVEGAEWYTELYRYADWLLLGIDDSRSLAGLEGCRYFLLLPESDRSRSGYEMPEGTPAAIYHNGVLYQYESGGNAVAVLNNAEAAGMIQSLAEGWPKIDFQANSPGLLGHLLLECDGKLLVSRDGGTYEVYGPSE